MCLYEFSNSSYYFFCKIEWIKIGWICDALHLWMFLQFLCNNFDTVHRIQTKFGMDILLDPRNKPAEEFFIFLKIQDGRRRSKICDALYFFNVFAITSIRLIGSRQNLAWTYYLTLGTSLRKNFSFFSKSKMAAGGQKFSTRYTFSIFS